MERSARARRARPGGALVDAALAAGSAAVPDTPRLVTAMDEMPANTDRREQLHCTDRWLLGHGQEVLGPWGGLMVRSRGHAGQI